MKQVVSDIVQFRGSHYEFGIHQAKLLQRSPILTARKRQWDKRTSRHFIVNEEKIKVIFQHFSPEIWEELMGLADGLDMSIKEAVREFGGYYFEYGKSGCSILMGNDYMIRNYDNDPITYEGCYVLYAPTDGGYATIGPSMQITGRTDGLNEKGLAVGYNFVNRLRSDDGFVCNMIGRLILEKCATVEEAVKLLEEIPHRHSFTYSLVDNTGRNVVVEASATEVLVREGTVCTNHFENLTKENRFRMDDSLRRYQEIEKQQSTIENMYDAYKILNDTDKGVFSKKYGAWAGTIHTTAYSPESLHAWIALGGDRLPFIIDFNKWLNGKNINVKQVKGELDATNGFINR